MHKTSCRAGILLLALLIVLSSGFCLPGEANTIQDNSQKEDESYKMEDVDKTLDKAIKVLSVIREDLKENEDLSSSKVDDASKAETNAALAARWIARINRMWKSVKQAAQDDDAASKAVPEPDIIDTKELSSKIGEAIDMMNVIKAEIEKDNPAEKE